ncbi:uncharacterized protein LOC62_02G003484 [Vanrija pseudolonga]|uniref:Condensation domain-containing protein n=1 Tax=Vanrija pseudolonga TaxID=143232 RepID=A0AAF0Y473_9TREE|nr:hypothetical protein LOC62_02G003484 [Vanrija pseudolonga]
MGVSKIEEPQQRRLTLFERYALATYNTGNPMVINFVVQYPSSELPAVEARLPERIAFLQAQLPMMSARLVDTKTTKPKWQAGPPWPTEKLLSTATIPPPRSDENELASIQRAELERFRAHDFVAGPVWSVRVFSSPTSPHGYVSFITNHVMTDGTGALRLVTHLLSAAPPTVEAEPFASRIVYEKAMPIKPGFLFLLPVLWREIIVPNLPGVLQRKFSAGEPWPGIFESPLGKPLDVALTGLPADTVARLKTAAKARGVATLHPVVQIAFSAAVWSVFHSASEPDLRFVTSVPKAERDVSKGHSSIGVYVALLESGGTTSGSQKFWDVARAEAKFLKAPATLDKGRKTIGLLAWIPDTGVQAAPKGVEGTTTGFERYLYERSSTSAPFFESLMISNLGLWKLPEGATDAIWGQANHPCSLALGSSIYSHDGGLRCSTQFYEGAPATRAQVERVHAVWMRLLERAADGLKDGATIAEATAD